MSVKERSEIMSRNYVTSNYVPFSPIFTCYTPFSHMAPNLYVTQTFYPPPPLTLIRAIIYGLLPKYLVMNTY